MPAASPRAVVRRRAVAAAPVALVALALTACGGATSPGASGGGTPTSASPTSAYPLTIDNCGTSVTFETAPTRVVTVKSSTTEMLLALGAGDTIVGTAYPDGPAPAPWTEAAAAIPVISDKVPSNEVVLAEEPDLVYAGWESVFSADGAGERASLEALGVRTLVAPSACKEKEYRPDPLTFDDVFTEIEQVGQLMDRSAEAETLVAAQRADLETVVPDARGLSALWFSSGSDTPYVGGGIGAPALIMKTAGLTNIAADIDDSWGPMGWEAVAAADPDVIVLVDSPWNSAEKKIGILEGSPVTAELSAVKNEAYVVVPFPATEAGVRTVSAAASVAEQLTKLTFED
ncbi:iron complex transport system substrate-binding protein [Flavimobilis soli]|uniref:Iron complex transport system substrate-binding protein n=1 Tax=Flavimobilis soli TaxID=442709 RepID=A0A2A9ECI2_9MICO|nr:putative F420-0 ABC transporter substrate-binding protein [Flavimobilis soli]PFG35995.1 iron complex transport system substrate-binding protein [Flavimobilis soli]